MPICAAPAATFGGSGPIPAAVLSRAAEWCREHDITWDAYGTGAVIESFEARVADLLGYPAARFMPSGTMAQPIALRVWCDRSGVRTFAMHPTSHLELHEQRGYAALHGLQAALVGPRDRPLLAEHLGSVVEPIGALLTELPIREAGGQLPSWDELTALKAAARDRGVALHLDGARLWCCGAAYDRPLDQITEGFDSCYVSFYKGIGALSGSMLLGPPDLIAQAKVWQRRMGGNLFSLLPNVVTAAMRLDAALASMPDRLAGARRLAVALGDLPGVRVYPDPPHTHLFHLVIDLEGQAAADARDRVAQTHGLWLYGGLREGQVPGTSRIEITVDETTLALDLQQIRQAFAALFA